MPDIQPFEFNPPTGWNNPTRFPTQEANEVQVRADMQELHDQTRDYINTLVAILNTLNAGNVVVLPSDPTIANMKFIRRDATTGRLYTSTNGTTWEIAASAGHIILDTRGGAMNSRNKLQFKGPTVRDMEGDDTTEIDFSAYFKTADLEQGVKNILEDGYVVLLPEINPGMLYLRRSNNRLQTSLDGENWSDLDDSAGHIVVNPSGVQMSQRAKLKFVGDTSDAYNANGVALTDDSGNDQTIVSLANLITKTKLARELADLEAKIPDSIITNTVVTNELYSYYGEIANLTVDKLRTDYEKAYNYVLGITSDINYLTIHDEQIEFHTASVKSSGGTPLVEYFTVDGNQMYWQEDLNDHDPAHGDWPLMGFTASAWPVYVYQYDDLLKGSFLFAEDSNHTKIPMLILGAGVGNQQDPARGKGIICKDTDYFGVWLHDTDPTDATKAVDNGIFMADGYTEIVGLRKPTELDFSSWGGTPSGTGSFTEELDGNISNTYTVDFDANGRPVKITDGDGHETVVTW